MENIQELMNSLQGFIEEQQQLEDGDPGLSNFLENIALSTDTQDKDDDKNKVS
jgi:DNA helicase-2/ATP-dependent DNA helicase PcrA